MPPGVGRCKHTFVRMGLIKFGGSIGSGLALLALAWTAHCAVVVRRRGGSTRRNSSVTGSRHASDCTSISRRCFVLLVSAYLVTGESSHVCKLRVLFIAVRYIVALTRSPPPACKSPPPACKSQPPACKVFATSMQVNGPTACSEGTPVSTRSAVQVQSQALPHIVLDISGSDHASTAHSVTADAPDASPSSPIMVQHVARASSGESKQQDDVALSPAEAAAALQSHAAWLQALPHGPAYPAPGHLILAITDREVHTLLVTE